MYDVELLNRQISNATWVAEIEKLKKELAEEKDRVKRLAAYNLGVRKAYEEHVAKCNRG